MAKQSLDEIFKRLESDKKFRIGLASESLEWFCFIYLQDHFSYPFAAFHKEILKELQDFNNPLYVLVAFRMSGKTSSATLAYPLWAAITGKRKYILVISKTEAQVKQMIYNIKAELELNEQLIEDFGSFVGDVWNEMSMVLPRQGVRITGLSTESGMRGLKNRQNRPDLFLVDDIEDLDSVKSIDGRDKTYQWLSRNVIPAGKLDGSTKLVLTGSLLHQDSTLMRLKQEIEKGQRSGRFRNYPFLDSKGYKLWPSRYRTDQDIDKVRKIIGSGTAWEREMLLKIVPEEGQIIKPEWIKYYDELPPSTSDLQMSVTAVDPASSKETKADNTGIVSIRVYGHGDSSVFYVMPTIINAKMSMLETITCVEAIDSGLNNGWFNNYIIVEEVAYQVSLTEMLRTKGRQVEGFKVGGRNKWTRLIAVSPAVQAGRVYFPKGTSKELIEQILGLGAEARDDLVDAFTMALHVAMQKNQPMPEFRYL